MKPTRAQLDELKAQTEMLRAEYKQRMRAEDLAMNSSMVAFDAWQRADEVYWEAFCAFHE